MVVMLVGDKRSKMRSALVFSLICLISWAKTSGNECDGCDGQDSLGSRRSARSVGHTSTYVMLSRQIVLDCVHGKDKKKRLVDPEYTWKDRKELVLKDGRFQTSEGKLKIMDAQAKDEGYYTCRVKHGKDIDVFRHLLMVYVIPDFSYKVRMQYKAYTCTKSQNTLKVSRVRASLCKEDNCPMQQFHGVCHQVTGDVDRKVKELWISFIVTTKTNLKLPTCDAACVEKYVLKTLNSNLDKVYQFERKEKASNGKVFNLKTKGVKVSLVRKCPQGFRREGVICRPCLPGSFSTDNDKACDPCPQGSYQPNYAMKMCNACGEKSTTKEVGATSKKDCQLTSVVAMIENQPSPLIVGLSVSAILTVIFMGLAGAMLKIYLNAIKREKPIKKPEMNDDEDDDDLEAGEPLLPTKSSRSKGWVVSKEQDPNQVQSVDLLPVFRGESIIQDEHIYMEPTKLNPPANTGVESEPIYETTDVVEEAQNYWQEHTNDPSLTESIPSHPPPQILPGLLKLSERLGPLPELPEQARSATVQSTRL